MRDDKFDEYILERIDYSKFILMQKDIKGYKVEHIIQKPIDRRSIDDTKFVAWHLKFRMPHFRQY